MNSFYYNNTTNMLVSSFQQYVQTISPNSIQQGEINVTIQNCHNQHAFNNPINSQSRPITKLSSQVYENSNTPSSNGQSHYYQYQISPNSSTYQTSPILSSFSVSPSSSIEDTLCSISNQRPLRHEFQTKDQRKKQLPIRSAAVDINELVKYSKKNTCSQFCTFCKNNNESEKVYRSHILKDATGKIVCPILKLHKCPTCGASGEQAHTITYCKKFQHQRKLQVLQNALNNICKD